MSLSKSAPVELDFFRMDMERESPAPILSPTRRRITFKDIQREVSKLNPEVIKSVFASAAVDHHHFTFGKESGGDFNHEFGAKQSVCAPMTIFYNGTVSVFDVPHHHAENILQMAQQEFSKMCIDPKYSKMCTGSKPSSDPINLLQRLTKGLPVSRRRSLKYFLKKRRERLTMISSPYGCTYPNHHNAHNSSNTSISLSLSLYQDQV